MKKIEQYWIEFLKEKGMPQNTPFSGECCFGCNIEMSEYLLSLVVSGHKKASSSVFEAYELDNEPIPHVGGYYVITDCNEKPYGVIETTKVTILPYKDITWEMAKKEGEDETMASWKRNHDEAFEEDADIMGYGRV